MSGYVFICSPGHSGSTLLDLLLGAHPQIESVGEITKLPKNIALDTECACGKVVSKCDLWSRVVNKMQTQDQCDYWARPYSMGLGPFGVGGKVVFDSKNMTRRWQLKNKILERLRDIHLRYGIEMPFIRRLYSNYLGNNFRMFDTVLEEAQKTQVVDSSKNILKAVGAYLLKPEQVKIIVLIRNGKGVYYSGLKRGSNRRRALRVWLRYYRRLLPLLNRHVDQASVLNVRYEDLVENLEETLKTLCDFVDLEYSDAMLDYGNVVHHATAGNQGTLKTKRTLKLDESWKQGLSELDLSYFERHAGDVYRELGYESDKLS